MRIFNRLIVVLLLVGLFVLGVYAVVYAFNLFGYSLSDLGFSGVTDGAQSFVNSLESGASFVTILILILVALVGLILLLAELRPSTPRRVRADSGTFLSRRAVEGEAVAAAEGSPLVTGGASAKAKAQRRPGARVDLQARVRRGEDLNSARTELQNTVRERLSQRGVPLSRLNVNLVEIDPKQAKSRVQ